MKAVYTFLGVLGLSACATVDSQLPVPDAAALAQETSTQTKDGLSHYLSLSERLSKVSYPVISANAPLCTKTQYDPGLIVHTQKNYAKDLRAAAKQQLSAGAEPSILLVNSAGPAKDLPIKRGDEILDHDGKPAFIKNKDVQADLKAGRLTTRRGDIVTTANIAADIVCDYPVSLKSSSVINAYADGRSISVTTGMMDFVNSDEELALVIGHELAHNTKNHVRKSIWNALVTGFAKRYLRPFEAEADYVGLYYMERAGFNADNVEDFWRRLGTLNPKVAVTAKTHPVTAQRFLAIKMTREEIAAKRAAGQALIPNAKTKT